MLQRHNIQSESDIREAMQLCETRIATQQQENRLAGFTSYKVSSIKEHGRFARKAGQKQGG